MTMTNAQQDAAIAALVKRMSAAETAAKSEAAARKAADAAEAMTRQEDDGAVDQAASRADAALSDRIAAVSARVAALEVPVIVPPVVPPQPRPFPAPVTTQAVNVPSSLDPTGATDVSVALNAWLRTQADGSIVRFPLDARYLLSTALNLDGRKHLVFDGNGAALRSAGGWVEANSIVQAFGAEDLGFHDLGIVGATTTPGVYASGKEGAHGIRMVMGSRIELDGCDISGCYGDGWNTDYWTDGVWVHDSAVHDNGRVACAILSGKNLLIERNVFDHNGGMVLDIEPYEADGGCWDLTFRDNVTHRQAKGAGGPFDLGYWAGGNGGGGGIRNITIAGNTLDEFMRIIFAVPGTGLRYSNIVITNNVARTAVAGPILDLRHIDGLDLRGNVQPLTSGVLASITDCTGIVQ